MKSVSVIIPNFNGQLLLHKNLTSVFEMVREGDEVIIVDDHSSDNSIDWLTSTYNLKKDLTKLTVSGNSYSEMIQYKRKHIYLIVVQNEENVRFGATCNKGALLANHELLFLLNNDVRPESDTLNFLVPHFKNDATFAVGCIETERLRSGKVTSSGKNILQFKRGMYIHSRANEMTSGETAWVSGGSGLFDKAKWNTLKGFDTAFAPAYWEDVDLSFRARERGWKVLFDSRAKVDHTHETTNGSTFGNALIQKISWHNANYFTLKNSTWWQKIQYLIWKPYWWWKVEKK